MPKVSRAMCSPRERERGREEGGEEEGVSEAEGERKGGTGRRKREGERHFFISTVSLSTAIHFLEINNKLEKC